MQEHMTPHWQENAFNLLGVQIHPLNKRELLDFILGSCQEKSRKILAGANAFAMNLAYETPWYKQFMNDSDLVYCDGIGVKWAAALIGRSVPVRLTHLDWIFDLFHICEQHQLSLYLLGGTEKNAAMAKQQMRANYPGIPAVYSQHGYFDKDLDSPENRAVVAQINAAKPDIIFICFGMPLQEKWLIENWENLNVSVAIPGGATIDYISGEVERVPDFFVKYQVEWLGRLLREPKRLWKRYIIGNPLFLLRVIYHELLKLG